MDQLYNKIKDEQLFNVSTQEFREIIKITSHEIFKKQKMKRKSVYSNKKILKLSKN